MSGREGGMDFAEDDLRIDREIEASLRAVGRPAARVEFRESLRVRFLAVVSTESRATSGARAPERQTPERRAVLGWVGLLAAGLLAVLVFLVLRSPAPGWHVLDVAQGSVIEVDGAAVPVEDRAALARALENAEEIEVVRGDLVLRVGDLALLDLAQGTRTSLEGFGGRSSAVQMRMRVLSGRLRARTGPAFRGRSLRLTADSYEAQVTGTAFAVDYEKHGTCLCCLHGDVVMTSQALGPEPLRVLPERMCLIYREEKEREPKQGSHPEHHTGPLRKLEERAQEIWPQR